MPKPLDEDLFKESTMTFGEHLEELRTCLFKALIGLAVGFLLGLAIGDWVVDRIQQPLRDALTTYYQDQTAEKIERRLDELRAAGYVVPEDPKAIKKFVDAESLMFEEVKVNPTELLRALKKAHPAQFSEIPLPMKDSQEEFDSGQLVSVFIWHPIAEDSRIQTKSLSAPEAFVIFIKASLMVGILISSPWIFYQIWSFVVAGLYPHEKQYVHIFLPFSLALFFSGAALAFIWVFPPVLKFLFYFNSELGIDPDPRISEWIGFVLMLPLGFGISFQLPLVMLFLERIGIFDVHAYLSKWRIAILVIFVLAMFLTPADPTSMLLMAGPLTVLYFGGILLCHWLPRRRSPIDPLDA